MKDAYLILQNHNDIRRYKDAISAIKQSVEEKTLHPAIAEQRIYEFERLINQLEDEISNMSH